MNQEKFYIQKLEVKDNLIYINDNKILHKLKNVLCKRPGSKLEIVSEKRVYSAEIKSIKPLILIIKNVRVPEDKKLNINLYFSIVKKHQLEYIISKTAEFGIINFYPIITQRSYKKKLSKNTVNRLENKIIDSYRIANIEAFPNFNKPQNIFDLKFIGDYINILLDEKSDNDFNIKILNNKDINLLIGPEGGLTDEEKIFLKKNNFIIWSLGRLNLTASTAAISGVAILNYLLNNR